MTDPNKDFLQKLRATFQVEAEDHLQEIVANIVLLERADASARYDLVDQLLKRLHTLKGAARAVNLDDLELLCHATESVFSALRQSAVVLGPKQYDTLHQTGTLARSLLDEPSGRVRNQAASMVKKLENLATEISAGPALSEPVAVSEPHSEAKEFALMPEQETDESIPSSLDLPEPARADVVRVQARQLDAIRYQVEALLSVELNLQHHLNDLMELGDEMAALRERLQLAQSTRQTLLSRRPIGLSFETSLGNGSASLLEAAEEDRKAVSDSTDHQYELRYRRLASALSSTHRSLMNIRSKLMDATLDAALVPCSAALAELHGLVRNVARAQAKEVILTIHGEGIHIDRRITDALREALIHIVTNSVAHGIESSETREARGKASAGTLAVTVAHRGNDRICVTVTDDGAGIDVDRVVAAALNSGTVNSAQLARLTEQQKIQLALKSGVSTTAEVTHASGRGMGLAIVADKIASIGGTLAIISQFGVGCTFELSLPVRLATLSGLVLKCGDARYVIPVSGIDAVRILKDGDIQTVENRETLLVGERVVPVIRLRRLMEPGRSLSETGPENDEHTALIAQADGSVFALMVSEVLGVQEILPKSLGKQLRKVPCISGATQLGDDSLVPILALDDVARYGLAMGADSSGTGRKLPAVGTAKRVLVAEDSITSRLLLKHILEGAGYQVETAVDGLDALSKLRQSKFDIVVSDVEMPQLDGIALTERIRGNPKTSDTPLVLVTSLSSPQERERGLHAGADAYVVKGSFEQDNLLTTVRRLIR